MTFDETNLDITSECQEENTHKNNIWQEQKMFYNVLPFIVCQYLHKPHIQVSSRLNLFWCFMSVFLRGNSSCYKTVKLWAKSFQVQSCELRWI